MVYTWNSHDNGQGIEQIGSLGYTSVRSNEWL
jgi:hypothetical protein